MDGAPLPLLADMLADVVELEVERIGLLRNQVVGG
jgi:hypothetical protein